MPRNVRSIRTWKKIQGQCNFCENCNSKEQFTQNFTVPRGILEFMRQVNAQSITARNSLHFLLKSFRIQCTITSHLSISMTPHLFMSHITFFWCNNNLQSYTSYYPLTHKTLILSSKEILDKGCQWNKYVGRAMYTSPSNI